MKILLFLLMVVSFSATAMDDCITGSWYDPENIGSGVNIQVLDEQVVAFYYRNNQTWYSMQGDGEVFKMYYTNVQGTFETGDAIINVINNDFISFEYLLTLDFTRDGAIIPWCLSECYGFFDYVRLTQPVECAE